MTEESGTITLKTAFCIIAAKLACYLTGKMPANRRFVNMTATIT